MEGKWYNSGVEERRVECVWVTVFIGVGGVRCRVVEEVNECGR